MMLNLSLLPGDAVEIINKFKRNRVCTTGQVLEVFPTFILVKGKNYTMTINRGELISGTIEIIKKGEEIKMAGTKSKITKEILISEIRERGYSQESIQEIAEKFGYSKLSIKTYIGKWNILKELRLSPMNTSQTTPPPATNSNQLEKDSERITEVPEDAARVLQLAVEPVAFQMPKKAVRITSFVFDGQAFQYDYRNGVINMSSSDDELENSIIIDAAEIPTIIDELDEIYHTIKKLGGLA